MTTRGLQNPSIGDRYKLGYVEDPMPGHEMFRGYLAIPYLRPAGVIAIRFRCLQNHEHQGHGKYMSVAGDKPHLYNTAALMQQTPAVAITEGEIDAITADLCGIPAVGVAGAHVWQPHFRDLFLGYRDVYVLADGDPAGQQFGTTIAEQLPNAKVIPMPPGDDVNSLVVNHGRNALIERMK